MYWGDITVSHSGITHSQAGPLLLISVTPALLCHKNSVQGPNVPFTRGYFLPFAIPLWHKLGFKYGALGALSWRQQHLGSDPGLQVDQPGGDNKRNNYNVTFYSLIVYPLSVVVLAFLQIYKLSFYCFSIHKRAGVASQSSRPIRAQ